MSAKHLIIWLLLNSYVIIYELHLLWAVSVF